MSQLLEHILNENYVEASNIFEDRLNTILERKLVEKKKMMQSESSINPYRDVESRKKAGYVRASDVLPDPRERKSTTITKKRKAVPEPKKMPAVDREPSVKRPSMIQRNINTLMGRRPGDTPEPTKPEDKGGRVGKAVRIIGKGAAGAVGRLSDVAQSTWE